MTSVLSLDDIDTFTRGAGLDLGPARTVELREMLHQHPDTHRWRWSTWTELSPAKPGAEDLLMARALLGLLVLDEEVLWAFPLHTGLTDMFRRLEAVMPKLDATGTVRARRANGDEAFERTDTGSRLRLRLTPGVRGLAPDLLIVTGSAALTEQQRQGFVPAMIARPNPQIIYT